MKCLKSYLIYLCIIYDLFRQVHCQTKHRNDTITEIFNKCVCVLYYQCDADNYIITDGRTLINTRLSDVPVQRIFCTNETFVCCNERLKSISTSDVMLGDSNAEYTRKKVCGQKSNENYSASDEPSTTAVSEFPWMASIHGRPTHTTKFMFKCTGTLIHPRVILTAYHCVNRKTEEVLKVIVNGKNALSSIGDNPNEERNVVDVIYHPDYNSFQLYNDIALLFLDEFYLATSIHSPINTLCLPLDKKEFSDSNCIAVGWNRKDGKILRKAIAPLLNNNNECQSRLRETRLGPNFRLHDSFICTNSETERASCRGYGGSPLMCRIENELYQIGIASWVVDYGLHNMSCVYTDVRMFKDWINDEFTKKGINIQNL